MYCQYYFNFEFPAACRNAAEIPKALKTFPASTNRSGNHYLLALQDCGVDFWENLDGVVKSALYCACPPQAGCSIFAETRHTTCMASFLKKYYALYMNRFT